MEAIAGPGIAELLIVVGVIGMVVGAAVLLTVIPVWRICAKAGFAGALSLLMLVPVANYVLLFYLAFAEWPALTEKREGQG